MFKRLESADVWSQVLTLYVNSQHVTVLSDTTS